MRRLFSLIAIVLALALPATASAFTTLDQSQPDASGNVLFYDLTGDWRTPVAQTFTAGVTGALDSVSLFPRNDWVALGATVQIRTVSNGLPTSVVLASEPFPSASSNTWVDTTFTSPASVTAGTQYAIVLEKTSSASWYVGISYSNAYAGGSAASINGSLSYVAYTWDLGFKTYVNASAQPDAQIRLGSGSYVGDDTYNTDALDQKVFNTGVVEQKLTYVIKIQNDSEVSDSFKVKRSAGYTDGYRVRYYNAAGQDVTWPVTLGTFTTPSLAPGSDYVMRAMVKVRSVATLCSFTSRLITVSSVNDPSAKDAVRFTAARATPDLNCPPVAVNDTASITENQSSVTGNVLANDIDPDGDPMVFSANPIGPFYFTSLTAIPNTGQWEFHLNNSGPVDALNNGETLTQVIQYTVNDGNGGVSNTATLTITIHGVTDPD